MDAVQQDEAKEIISSLMQCSALMGSVQEEDEVPGVMVLTTGQTFLTSLAELASLIGGNEWRNEIVFDSMESISNLAKFAQIVDSFNN